MKDEIKRINKLVAEGKLSPEDAADLIDAFYESGREESSGSTPPPPPPPPGTEHIGDVKTNDPFKQIVESIERLGKEITQNVDWQDISNQARSGAKKGFDALKQGLEEVSKGKFNVGFLLSATTREIRLPLVLTESQLLKIENGSGHIEVDTDAVESYVVAKAKFRGATIEDAKRKADEYSLVVDTSEYAITIKQPQVSGLEVDLRVVVAGKPAVDIKSEAGDVTVRGTQNNCRIKSTAGSVDLVGLNGQIEIDCESGDVQIHDSETIGAVVENKTGNISMVGVKGNLNLRSATGNIAVHKSTGKTVSMEAVSGNVYFETEFPVAGNLSIRTVNGNAEAIIPASSDARVSLTTLRGISMTDVDLLDRAQSDQRITGRLGEGNGTIDISTITGNVQLSESNNRD